MDSPPVIAVVTPTKDRIALLRETIVSVQTQTFGAWEHLIVDDGSSDSTAEEVMRRSAADPRIRYIKRIGDKAGANVCRNIGLREARAELIVFLDSDDLLRPASLERRVEAMRNNRDLDFAVFQATVFKNVRDDLGVVYHPQTPGDDLLRFLSLECVWEISGPVWRRTFLEKIGGFDEGFLSMQDLEMHVRALAARGTYVFFCVPDHDIRGHDEASRTSTRHFNDPAYIEAAECVRDRLFNTVRNAGLLTWSRRRAVQGLSFGFAESWLKAGRAKRARKTWSEGCRRHGAPVHLQLLGLAMLQLLRCARSDSGPIFRLVNKWKGWVRFRQEPNLMTAADSATAQASQLAM
jgi:glycosyltransferase involved in cell wall biosynthesis